jgi:hypothetical protein
MTREEKNAYMKAWYQKNKEKVKGWTKRYKKANPKKVQQWNKEHDARRPDLVKGRQARNHKRHYAERKDKIKERQLQYLYSMSLEEYNQRVIDQNSLCAICKQTSDKRLCVDHDHVTGKIRSLLCSSCNLVLGQIENKRELVPIMLQYLDNYK